MITKEVDYDRNGWPFWPDFFAVWLQNAFAAAGSQHHCLCPCEPVPRGPGATICTGRRGRFCGAAAAAGGILGGERPAGGAIHHLAEGSGTGGFRAVSPIPPPCFGHHWGAVCQFSGADALRLAVFRPHRLWSGLRHGHDPGPASGPDFEKALLHPQQRPHLLAGTGVPAGVLRGAGLVSPGLFPPSP